MITNDKPFLIGETAFHHQGDVNFLNRLIDGGIKAGVDTLKFHLLFDIDDYFVRNHTAYDSLVKMLISKEIWFEIHRSLQIKGIKPIYLCNDIAALQWVNHLQEDSVAAVEIHATGIDDIFLLREASNFAGTVILGAGGSTLDDLFYAINVLRENGKDDILLMHGFQNYPTDYREIVFSKMNLLKSLFELPVGYADHTDPADELNAYISCLPQAQRFNILEKHFTCAPEEKRIDSQSAVSIEQLEKIKKLMEIVFQTHGDNPIKMSLAEKKYGDTGPMKKAIVARKNLPKGHIISISDIAFKRTNASTS